MRKELLIIGGALFGIGYLIQLTTPSETPTSYTTAIELTMTAVISLILQCSGLIILIAGGVLALVRKRARAPKCTECGTIVPSNNDEYCRNCGKPLSK